ncbi:MAG: hypothetical protein AABZ84_09860 [Pseudomonadota bacterium]
MLRLATILVLSLFCRAIVADAAVNHNFAASWFRMSEGARVTWLWGAAEGQSLVLEELPIAAKKKLENHLPFDKADVLARVITSLYADPANSYIPWKYMAVVANSKLNGATESEVAKRLELLRQYTAYELQKLRGDK